MNRLELGFSPLGAIFLAALAALPACGDDGSAAGGAGGTGGAGGSTGSITPITTATTTTTGTGGAAFDCTGAQTFKPGQILSGDLADDGGRDDYRFEGQKGQVLWIDVDAQSLAQVSFDPTYVDTVVTLFDEEGERLAENDNPTEASTPDSRLYTILPETGTYCIRVADCWAAKPSPAAQCVPPAQKTGTQYELRVFELRDDGPGDSSTADAEGAPDPAGAPDVDFVAQAGGDYFTAYVWGHYESDDDVDVFGLTLPAGVDVPAGARGHGILRAFRSGADGTGATIPTGEITLVDPDAPDTPLARVDPAETLQLDAPLDLEKEYYLFIRRPPGPGGGNDFYFLSAFPGWGNPVEADDAGNSDLAAAEPLALVPGTTAAFIEGDLAPVTDVDHFQIAAPPGATAVSAVCAARTRGSGLRDLTLTLLGADGEPLAAGAADVETATHLALVQGVPVAAGASVVLRVEAASQAPDTAGTFYQCSVQFTST